MKEGRRAGGITAGPESKVLDGATWEERADSVNKSFGMPDNVDYKVGAASKGIIQRDYQHNATVYKSVYAKNPFDNVSAEELAEYQRIVDLKSRGEGNPNLSMTSRWPKSKILYFTLQILFRPRQITVIPQVKLVAGLVVFLL